MSVRRNPFVAALFGFLLVLASCTDDDVAAPLSEPVPPSSDTEGPENPEPTESPDNAATPDSDAVEPGPGEVASLPGEILLRDGAGRIVITNPSGGAPTVLADAGSDHSQPTWSSSGNRVAWSSFGPDGATLNTASADGAEIQSQAVPAPAFYLSWSPNDNWIGGLRSASGGMETFVSPTSVSPVDQSGGRSITNAAPFYFEWATDTDIVAAVAAQFLADISVNSETDPLVRDLGAPLGFFQAPVIDPAGSIFATLNIDGVNTLVLVDGAAATPIATATSLMYLSLSPDGRRLAVLVAADGGSTEPEQQVISYQFDEVIELESARVTIFDLETGEAITEPDEDVLAMQWSPDSTTLALLRFVGSGLRWDFARESARMQGTEFVPSQRFLQRYLPFFDQYNLSSTWWSPDSSAIVFSGTVAAESGVFIDLIDDAAGPVLLSDGDIAFWSPNQG